MGAIESAESVMARLRQVHTAALFDPKDEFYSYKLMSLHAAIAEVSLSGDFSEFGVYRGRCARFLQTFLVGARRLHLFDSFEGLPEDWIGPWKKGAFALADADVPSFDPARVTLHKGWFKDTVEPFSRTLSEPLALLHVDSDLYSSAIDVLAGLNHRIAPGTILLFDEYVMSYEAGRDEGEHRALWDWSDRFGRRFEYLWRTKWVQVAVRVTV